MHGALIMMRIIVARGCMRYAVMHSGSSLMMRDGLCAQVMQGPRHYRRLLFLDYNIRPDRHWFRGPRHPPNQGQLRANVLPSLRLQPHGLAGTLLLFSTRLWSRGVPPYISP